MSTVTAPLKHGENSSSFISYLISPPDSNPVRRRFQDFLQIQSLLHHHLPSTIIPSLPGKAHRTYIVGDRFSGTFVDRRMKALQSFVERCENSESIRDCEVWKAFLTVDQMRLVKGGESFYEGITNSILSLTKPKVPSP